MCVGMPGKVIQVKNSRAQIKTTDHTHWVDISLIQEKVQKGNYLICYQDAAINKITPAAAQEVLSLLGGKT